MRCAVWSVLLFLGCARGSTYPQLCLPVYYDRFEHSTWAPDIPFLRSYTMFQEFCIKNSTAELTTNFTGNASWSHDHHSLSDPSHYHINNLLRPYWKDGRQCVNSSLTLLNVRELDHGVYTVAVSTNCGSQSSVNFTLQISPPCSVDDPRPVNPTQKPIIVSGLSRPPSLTFQFQGDSKSSDYIFYLMKSGEEIDNCILCFYEETDCENMHIYCHRNIPQCNTTLSVQFHNFTTQDTGKYCVAPSLLGSGSIGNMSCVELDVRQSDQGLTVPLAVSLGVGVPVIIIIIFGCVCIVVVTVYKKNNCQGGNKMHGAGRTVQPQYGNAEVAKPLLKTGFTTSGYQSTQNALTPFVGIDIESTSIHGSTQIKNGTTPRGCEALWQKLPNVVLNTSQLQIISKQLTHWEPLARLLGLEQPDIIEIQENYPRNYKQQKFQMLCRWSQEEKQASLKSLVRCIEIELGDRKLAQNIVAALK